MKMFSTICDICLDDDNMHEDKGPRILLHYNSESVIARQLSAPKNQKQKNAFVLYTRHYTCV